MTPALADPVRLRTGHVAPNRIALAPLTNQMSNADGKVSPAEIAWLAMRARGGFGIVSTAAAAVTAGARAFPGQLGFYDERHLPGLSRLAAAAKSRGAVAIAQLLHGGPRALEDPVGFAGHAHVRPIGALELYGAVAAFADAAVRARAAGFDGVQLHAAYGFLHSAYLAHDFAGGAEYLRETLATIRTRAGDEFVVSLRLNVDGYGQRAGQMMVLAQALLGDGLLDHLDLVAERPLEGRLRLPAHDALVQVTGNVGDRASAEALLAFGADVVGIGTAAVLHHDCAARMLADAKFHCAALPVASGHLAREGVSGPFLDYLRKWPGFVHDDQVAA